MTLRKKRVKGKEYYYLELSFFVVDKAKKFSKYLGAEKPSKKELERIEEKFKEEILQKLSGKNYKNRFVSKEDLVKALVFRQEFDKKFASLSPVKKKKYEIDRTIIFTLTTLTTEDVDVSLDDVENAFKKETNLNLREQISKNMIEAVNSIKQKRPLSSEYLLELHKKTMSQFETKNPGQLRNKQVYLHKRDKENPLSIEIAYRPPAHQNIGRLLEEFVEWYNKSTLNPIEKATLAHLKLYRIHPFLDGNKRICRLVFNKALLEEGFPLINISEKKEAYFEALIESTEKNDSKKLTDFSLKEYFRQIKEFLKKRKGI